MRIDARLGLPAGVQGPDQWEEDWGRYLPLDHVICRDVDGTPHTVGKFVWPWTAYTAYHKKLLLHFFYWKPSRGKWVSDAQEITPAREARMRELQFLMTRQIYYGNECAPATLYNKLSILHLVALYAEARSYSVYEVLTQTALLDACGASLPDYAMEAWISWVRFLRQLDPQTQLGFSIAPAKLWKDVQRRAKEYNANCRQFPPLPTRVYAALINNLSAELDDIEANKSRLLAALSIARRMRPVRRATLRSALI